MIIWAVWTVVRVFSVFFIACAVEIIRPGASLVFLFAYAGWRLIWAAIHLRARGDE